MQTQRCKRPDFFSGQPSFHQTGSYLPIMMPVMTSPRLLNLQWKPKWPVKPQQAHLVLSKPGPEERDKLGLMGTDLVTMGGSTWLTTEQSFC